MSSVFLILCVCVFACSQEEVDTPQLLTWSRSWFQYFWTLNVLHGAFSSSRLVVSCFVVWGTFSLLLYHTHFLHSCTLLEYFQFLLLYTCSLLHCGGEYNSFTFVSLRLYSAFIHTLTFQSSIFTSTQLWRVTLLFCFLSLVCFESLSCVDLFQTHMKAKHTANPTHTNTCIPQLCDALPLR